ncbi:MAG TPA: hypothetical protein PKY59_07645 [Pyrinomonadaceae bacterium]|nr:hypothetical protein [Pyrinomonadaceae bacterium]
MDDKTKQLSFPFHVFEEEVLNPINGQQMSPEETFIAQMILDGTSEKPIKMQQIIDDYVDVFGEKLSERQLKIIIRSFRRDRAFPILSRRAAPAGYWWCQSVAEMKEFARLWQSQYFDEMRTLYVMMKHNFPQLAGQMRLPNTGN